MATDWTQAALTFTPPWTVTGEAKPTITVPEGGTVLVDGVECHPAPEPQE